MILTDFFCLILANCGGGPKDNQLERVGTLFFLGKQNYYGSMLQLARIYGKIITETTILKQSYEESIISIVKKIKTLE